ncbi:MAG: alpha/beta fold hydrolase [Pseudonocardiaceae bacterium]
MNTVGQAAESEASVRRVAAVTVAGVRTRVIECAGAGPTVLLLHGFTDSADGWRAVMEPLAAAGHRVVALDLPYFVRAERPTPVAFLPAIDEFVAAASRQYDSGEGVVLVGNSVAGLTALRAAQQPGLPLAGVVAIGPAGLCTPWWMKLLSRIRPLTDRLLRLPIPPVMRGTGPALISAGFAAAVAPGRLDARARAQYASHWGPGDLRRQLVLGTQTITELTGPDVLGPASFVAPVTLVWGTRDWICPPRVARATAHDRDVAVQLIPGAGHCPQYDQPRVVADIIATARRHARAPSTNQEWSS